MVGPACLKTTLILDPTSSTERMIDFEEISTGKIYIAMPVPSEEYE